MSTTSASALVAELAGQVSGSVLGPHHEGYEAARAVHNGLIDFATGRWLNYLGPDQAEDAIRAAYGPNYDRLREVKRRYDPDNVFHLNHNVAP